MSSNRVKDERKSTKVLYHHFLDIMYESHEIYFFDFSTLKFVEVNTVACRNLGYTLEELLALTPTDVMVKLTDNELQRLIQPLLAGKQGVVSLETSHLRKDSTIYPVEVRLHRVDNENQTLVLPIVKGIVG